MLSKTIKAYALLGGNAWILVFFWGQWFIEFLLVLPLYSLFSLPILLFSLLFLFLQTLFSWNFYLLMPLQWDFDGLCGVDFVKSEFNMLQPRILRHGIILDYVSIILDYVSAITTACLCLHINHLFEKLLWRWFINCYSLSEFSVWVPCR